VDTANTGARRLYERVGFRTVETSPPARFAGGAAAHRMVRDLADPGAGRG
jgi:ribosomal protein S18 acetylase RimI-like enzyme